MRVLVADIQMAVCDWFGITKADLLGRSHERQFARPRQIGVYLAKNICGRSYPEAARAFHRADHSTAVHACRNISRLLSYDCEVEEDVHQVRDRAMQVAARRIERRLAA